MSPPRNRCGGFCGRAVRSAPAAARRFARHGSAVPLSLRTTPPAPAAARRLAGRLNKTRIFSPQPAVFRRSGGGGSLAPLAPCRLRRHILAACGGSEVTVQVCVLPCGKHVRKSVQLRNALVIVVQKSPHTVKAARSLVLPNSVYFAGGMRGYPHGRRYSERFRRPL